MAGNGCQAACMYDKAEIAAMDESNCGAKGKLLHDNAACGCSDPEEPMCDRFMTEVAKSPCIAKCAGYTDAKPCSVKNSNNRTIVDLPGDKGTDVIIGFNLPESNEDGDKEPGTILIVKDGASNQNSINGEDKEATDGGGLSVLDPPVGSVTTFDVRNNTDDNSSTTIARRQDVVRALFCL